AARVHALGDVARLLVQMRLHLAGFGGKADGRVRVADFLDHLADNAVHGGAGQVGVRGDFAGDDGQVGGDHGLARHAAHGVGGEAVIEYGVADLVRDLVGMA